MSFNSKSYKQELRERQVALEGRIVTLEKQREATKCLSKQWFMVNNELNLRRIDLITVKSHLNKLGKKIEMGITPMTVDRNHLK